MDDAANTVGNGNKRGPLRPRSRDDRRLPRDLDIQADEGTAAEQEDGEVAGAGVKGGNHEHSANHAGQDAADDVPAVLEVAAAGPGDRQGDEVGDQVWGCLDVVALRFEDRCPKSLRAASTLISTLMLCYPAMSMVGLRRAKSDGHVGVHLSPQRILQADPSSP